MPNARDYYRILHVQPDAPVEIIRTSYRTLMRGLRMHPDVGGDTAAAAEINEAFAVLSDAGRRAIYDAERGTPSVAAAQPQSLVLARVGSDIPLTIAIRLTCSFCDASCAVARIVDPSARCDRCGSPLVPIARDGRTGTGRRAFHRVDRSFDVTCWTMCQREGASGPTKDLSVGGLSFLSPIRFDLERTVRIDSEVLEAVGIVRHVSETPAIWRVRWMIGVEFVTVLVKQTRGSLVSTRI